MLLPKSPFHPLLKQPGVVTHRGITYRGVEVPVLEALECGVKDDRDLVQLERSQLAVNRTRGGRTSCDL